ncbi:hypothetical protein RHMOL_Rhmol06G0016300 [Rhododendron molle]|uniref:Uncharacterized protein n=2 Tax=Rhododendron molle TaxID=49168 RepID=A0ACC0N7N5_RHOML|nr:hypothetical protein RHMOL_Rhmol06G0016300 [Rhododendron molle]KAI8549319.1 hypothetical protein RHMOL_Rhmol06G0016300 [Rhododendron molle]
MQGYVGGDKDEVRILPMLFCSSHVGVWVVARTGALSNFVNCCNLRDSLTFVSVPVIVVHSKLQLCSWSIHLRFLLTLTLWLGTDGCSDVVGIQGIVRLWAGNHDSFGVACGLPCTYLLCLVWVGIQVVQHSSENVFELIGLWMVVAELELVVVSMAPEAEIQSQVKGASEGALTV